MAIQSQPSRIPEPFAGSGTKNIIPAANATPSASQAASWASGFPPECSQPISAGGCPVPRNDMNGILNTLSQDYAFRQDGGVWAWSAQADYDSGRLVRGSNGSLYVSIATSGPSVAAGAQDPTTDDGTYWMYVVTEQWVRDNLAPNVLYLNATSGNDSNSGLTESEPMKTFAAAQYKLTGLKNYANLSSYVKIVLLPGNYGSIVYEGNQLPPIWFEGRAGATLATLRVTGATQVKLSGNITFDSSASEMQLYCASNCYMLISSGSTITFKGSCTDCLRSSRLSTMYIGSATLVFSSVTVSDAVARTQDLGLIYCYDTTITGTATGKRYYASNISEINTNGGGENFFPGTTAGSTSSTSIYL